MLVPSHQILLIVLTTLLQMLEDKVVLFQSSLVRTSTLVLLTITMRALLSDKRLTATLSALTTIHLILNSISIEIQLLPSLSQTVVSHQVELQLTSLELGSVNIQCTVSSHSADLEISSSEEDSSQQQEFSAHPQLLNKVMQLRLKYLPMLSIGLTLVMISDTMRNQFSMISDQGMETLQEELKSGSRAKDSPTLPMDLRLSCADSLRRTHIKPKQMMILVCKRRMTSTHQLDSCQHTTSMQIQ